MVGGKGKKMRLVIISAWKMIKVFLKVGNYEGWIEVQNLPIN